MKNRGAPYIFITGLFRSGTTLLTRALSAHPDIEIFYQPFAPFFQSAVQKFWQDKGYKKSRPMGDPLLFERFYEDFNENVLSIEFTVKEIENIKKRVRDDYEIDAAEKSEDAAAAFEDAKGTTFGELFISALENLGNLSATDRVVICGVKEIWCEDFLPALISQSLAAFKCIHVLRDPRAVVASRNYGKYLTEGCGGQKYPILFIARSWRRSAELSRRLAGSGNYFTLRYEDLVNHPEERLRDVSGFLDVRYDPAMLDYSRYRGGNGKPWHGNVNSRQLDHIDTGSAERWKSIISDDDQFLCEFLCSEEMSQLGYEPITDCKDTGRFHSITEDSSAQGAGSANSAIALMQARRR